MFAMMLAQGATNSSGKTNNSLIQGFLWGGMLTKTAGMYFQGEEEKAVAKANIGQLEYSLDVANFKGQLEEEQFDRFRKKYSGTLATRVAKMGLEFTGSPMEVMNDAITQINIDEAITRFNNEMAKNQLLYQRDLQRNAVKMAKYTMIANIVSTIASTAGMAWNMRSASAPKTNQLSGSKLSGTFDVPDAFSTTRVGRSAYTFN